jgi:ferredoxin-NADP reductase
MTLRIERVSRVTPRARAVKLALDGRPFSFRPGQAVMIAAHGSDNRRAYSIASAPEEVKRHGRIELLIGVNPDGSLGPHLTLEPGTLVDVEGPIGQFTFPEEPEERRFVFVAGGTGIAPLRSMLHDALKVPDRDIRVLYSARTPADFAYQEELRQLANDRRIALHQTVTREPGGQQWEGPRGRISLGDLEPSTSMRPAVYFVCGPQPLVAEIKKLLSELDVPAFRVRSEEWTPARRVSGASR